MAIGTIRPIRIEEELRHSYMDYAMSVIVSRALPDVRDGLKPVQRRILYAMEQLGVRPNTAHKKSARIVGEVMGKFHPHGDAPVYDAMVRLAQDFSLRYPLVDGQGNFGSIDNDPPAAMRYTEARLASIAMEMLADIDKETVDFQPNFDDSLSEPRVLPSIIPNLLANGSSGIAVGMATNIPPHNLGELCDALIHLIDNPDTTLEELGEIVKGPDFPTGGIILGQEGIRQAQATGRGRLIVQGKAEVDGRQIIISEVPYFTNKAALAERIALLIRGKRLEGASEVRDESDRQGLRVVVELRREGTGQRILNTLYRLTPLRTSYAINMLALADGQPRVLTIKEALQHHIDFRHQVITRRSQYELRQAQERAHLVEGLIKAIRNLDEVISLIRNSASAEAARTELMDHFSLSQLQAQAILDMPLRRLAALETQKIEDEYAELLRTIAYLEDLLANPRKILYLIQEELRGLKSRFADTRRTQIGEEAEEVPEEAYIPHQQVMVTVGSRYLKRLPPEIFRTQRRGGKGLAGTGIDEGRLMLVVDTHDYVMFFSDSGKVYTLKAYHLPAESSRTARGAPLLNVLERLTPRETITSLAAVPTLAAEGYLLQVTRQGVVKKTRLADFSTVRTSGLFSMNLRKEDMVACARTLSGEEDVVVVSRGGKAVRFPSGPLRTASRASGGVRAMRLEPNDRVVGMEPVSKEGYLLFITTNGFGKRVPLDRFPTKGRGGKGVVAMSTSAKTGPIAAASLVVPGQDVVFLSAQGQVLHTQVEGISIQGRHTRGVNLMTMDEGDEVVTFFAFHRQGKTPPA
ncbi:MAG: DNA gyrase subunit A [Dehalococcoidia bacterium]